MHPFKNAHVPLVPQLPPASAPVDQIRPRHFVMTDSRDLKEVAWAVATKSEL
jgi:hypothetical protein